MDEKRVEGIIKGLIDKIVESGLGIAIEDPCYPGHYHIAVGWAGLKVVEDMLMELPLEVKKKLFVQVRDRPPKHLMMC